jgi:molybdopterin synthase sulfur carrier subunit
MPRVVFTSNLRRHIGCPDQNVTGTTVREALDSVFDENQKLRGYLLDDQNRLRQHVVSFVDGLTLQDRDGLSDSVKETVEIYVMQALSGG